MIKKTLPLFIIFFGILFFTNIEIVHGDNLSCNWLVAQTSSSAGAQGGGTVTTGTCESKNLKRSDGSCEHITKPAYSSIWGEFLVCCCEEDGTAVKKEVKETLFKAPDLQIKIPGMENLQNITCKEGEECEIPWLGEYVLGIYNYAVSIIGILAAVMLMAGGLMWLVSRGDASKVAKAKEFITGSITGVIILLGSFLLLSFINPSLVSLQNIRINVVKSVPDLGGDRNDMESLKKINTSEVAQKLNIDCRKDSLTEIVKKTKGNTSYNKDLRGTFANSYVNFDCSSYAYFILDCGKGIKIDAYTGSIFLSQYIWNQKTSSLKEGDLVGWAPKNNKKNNGHVFIYLGNDKFADCHSVKEAGGCIGEFTLEKIKNYAESHSDGNLYIKSFSN